MYPKLNTWDLTHPEAPITWGRHGTSDNQKRSHKAQTLTLTNLVFGRKSLRNSLKAVNLLLILIGFLNLKGIIDLL